MLLNEVQLQSAEIRNLKQQVAELKDLKQELHAAVLRLQAQGAVIAKR
jgi:t-SNARE complex subunit (syntaxin)